MQIIGEGNGTHSMENPMDGGAWWAAGHGVAKSRTWLGSFTFTFHFHPLKKEMAAHSSVFAWRIPGTGVPGGLPSVGSHRVRHDWSVLAAAVQIILIHQRTRCFDKIKKFCTEWPGHLCIHFSKYSPRTSCSFLTIPYLFALEFFSNIKCILFCWSCEPS